MENTVYPPPSPPLLLTMEEAAYSLSAGGQGVGRVLNREVERRSWRCTPPLLLAMDYALYSSSSQWRRRPTRKIEDEEHNTYSIAM